VTNRSLGTHAVAAALSVAACARQTDAQTRNAFEAAANPTVSTGTTPRLRPGSQPRKPVADAMTSWQGVNVLVEKSIALLASDVDARAFTEAATRHCAVKPEPRSSSDGPSYACFPRDPLEIGKRSFTLDISPAGAMGLHMDELDEATSKSLAGQARDAVAKLCATPFAAAANNDAENRVFDTCPVDGGSTLAVGHARSTVRPGWFVAITVLSDVRQTAAP
jgi:hypothetical protein